MRGRCGAAASARWLRRGGLQGTALVLLFAVAACTPVKYPPDRNAAEVSAPARAETAVEAAQSEVEPAEIDPAEVDLAEEAVRPLEGEEGSGGFWAGLGSAFGLSGDAVAPLDIAGVEGRRGDRRPDLRLAVPPPPSLAGAAPEPAAETALETKGAEEGAEQVPAATDRETVPASTAFDSDGPSGTGSVSYASYAPSSDPSSAAAPETGEAASEEEEGNGDGGGFWSSLGETFGLSESGSEEVAASGSRLAAADGLEPQGSADPEAYGEPAGTSYAEYDIAAMMLDPAEETDEPAPVAAEGGESEGGAGVEVAQILAEIQAAAEVASESDDAPTAEPGYEALYGAAPRQELAEIQKAQADGASFTDFDYEALYLTPVVGSRAAVLRAETFVAEAGSAPRQAAEPDTAQAETGAPYSVPPETAEMQVAEAAAATPPEAAANEERLGFWSSLGDSLGFGASRSAVAGGPADDTDPAVPSGQPVAAAAPALVAQAVASPAPAAAPEAGAPETGTPQTGADETVQPLVEASAAAGTAGEQMVALTPGQIESARRAFAVPVRPGDVVEVRFYRNTRLDNRRYDIVVGDLLRVDVFDQPELSRESVLVLPDGYISLPLVGSLQAAGWTVDELSTELTRRLLREQLLDPRVSVAVIDSDKRLQAILNQTTGSGGDPIVRFTVADSGVLNLPYLEPIDVGGRSVSDLQELIRRAYREAFHGQLEVTVNLNSRAIPVVYVMGEVVNPIAVEVSGRFNPLMAVAAAGGFLPTAAPDEVRVIRVKPNGEYDQWAFDLEGGLDGELVNGAAFQLVPQDVVIVPPSGIATANRWVDQWVRQLLPFSLSAGFGISYDLNDSSDD